MQGGKEERTYHLITSLFTYSTLHPPPMVKICARIVNKCKPACLNYILISAKNFYLHGFHMAIIASEKRLYKYEGFKKVLILCINLSV